MTKRKRDKNKLQSTTQKTKDLPTDKLKIYQQIN